MSIKTVISTRVLSSTRKRKGLVYIFLLRMGPSMKVIGRMMTNKGRESTHLRMEGTMKETGSEGREKEKEYNLLMHITVTKGDGKMIGKKVLGNNWNPVEINTRETSSRASKTEKES